MDPETLVVEQNDPRQLEDVPSYMPLMELLSSKATVIRDARAWFV